MRFVADGPSIPDDLLIARDAGDVIFFCGAGVSQHEAHLPNFEGLSSRVIEILGAALDSPARKLLSKAIEMGRMAGVGGLVATDRVFGLLEREFEVADVRAAIAEAIRPDPDCGLGAHRIVLDLATSRTRVTRLVTTNFDLLFEECDPSLPSSGPPQLPDPTSDHDFRGVIHLHGRVDTKYQHPHDDEFVVSSADFGRAYLADGWATRFIQALLTRFQIVFIGYGADDPPVQYLLEALNLQAGSKRRLFAFHAGESSVAAAVWEHRGVHAIAFDNSSGYAPLWDTLAAWATRARDIDGWYADLFARAAAGPVELDPHIRGQVAHVASTREGARRIAVATEPLDASWLLVFDPNQRYATPCSIAPDAKGSARFDPFTALHLDTDMFPEPADPENQFERRKIPDNAWDILKPTRLDFEETREVTTGGLRGETANLTAALPPRLASIGVWIQRVAHHPIVLWWAAQQSNLHQSIKLSIKSALLHDSKRFPEPIRSGWRNLTAAWDDVRADPDIRRYEIQARSHTEGWTPSLIRDLADLYRPQLRVSESFWVAHPLHWNVAVPDIVVRVDVAYPRPHEALPIPDDQLRYAVSNFRENLELAVALKLEISRTRRLHFETSRADDDGPDLPEGSYGLTGLIIYFQNLMGRLVATDAAAARAQVVSWPTDDEHVFARLRIWACSTNLLSADEAAKIFLSLSDIVFWGALHERDLLYALRDRWAEMSDESCAALENRLLKGSYPWDANVPGGREHADAYNKLSRLHWLRRAGVAFTFDVDVQMDALRPLAPEWTERAGEATADSHAPRASWIGSDTAPDLILDTPIAEILARASEVGGIDLDDRVKREPFRGLADRRPARALAALSHAARLGEAPSGAWREFLYADARPTDSARMIGAIAARLERLPPVALREIVYPVSEWMERIATRLYADAAAALPELWSRVIEVLRLGGSEHPRRPDDSWADAALNAPVGKLVNFAMKDPAKDAVARGAGFQEYWTERLEQLLELPGDLRRHALVMICNHVRWLFWIDPVWTERQLLSAAEDPGSDGDAFWEGALWGAKGLAPELFARLKRGLVTLTRQPSTRRHHSNVIAATLLAAWGPTNDAAESSYLISDAELREVLIGCDDTLRLQFIWLLEQWSSDTKTSWRERVLPFLRHVWPNQRALRTPTISARLADFAFASGELMPDVVRLILPRLVPVRGSSLQMLLLKPISEDHPTRRFPRETLDLLSAVLAEDSLLWPYRVEVILENLATAPETAADPRLSELRRRRER